MGAAFGDRLWKLQIKVSGLVHLATGFSTYLPVYPHSHFLIHTLALTSFPAGFGGGSTEEGLRGYEGWPLLIQRLGICIWLLFVNQWCDCAGRRVSPRLSLPLSLSLLSLALSFSLSVRTLARSPNAISENTITRRKYYVVTWSHCNWRWSTHEPSPLFLLWPGVLFSVWGGDSAHRRGETGMFLPPPKSVKRERKPMRWVYLLL